MTFLSSLSSSSSWLLKLPLQRSWRGKSVVDLRVRLISRGVDIIFQEGGVELYHRDNQGNFELKCRHTRLVIRMLSPPFVCCSIQLRAKELNLKIFTMFNVICWEGGGEGESWALKDSLLP